MKKCKICGESEGKKLIICLKGEDGRKEIQGYECLECIKKGEPKHGLDSKNHRGIMSLKLKASLIDC